MWSWVFWCCLFFPNLMNDGIFIFAEGPPNCFGINPRGQGTACGSWCASTFWIPGMELPSSASMGSSVSCGTISVAHLHFLRVIFFHLSRKNAHNSITCTHAFKPFTRLFLTVRKVVRQSIVRQDLQVCKQGGPHSSSSAYLIIFVFLFPTYLVHYWLIQESFPISLLK